MGAEQISFLVGRDVKPVSSTNPLPITLDQYATGTARLLSAVGTSQDATIVKAAAGRIFGAQGYNAASSVRFLKFYNKATAPSSSDTPVKTIALPPTAAFALDWPLGYAFAAGISFRLTTGVLDNDATGVTAADILGLNVDYN